MATNAAAELASRLEKQISLSNYVESLDLADANQRLDLANAAFQAACWLLRSAYDNKNVPGKNHAADHEKGLYLLALARKIRQATKQHVAKTASAAETAFDKQAREFADMPKDVIAKQINEVESQNSQIESALAKMSLKQANADIIDDGIRETMASIRAEQQKREEAREQFQMDLADAAAEEEDREPDSPMFEPSDDYLGISDFADQHNDRRNKRKKT